MPAVSADLLVFASTADPRGLASFCLMACSLDLSRGQIMKFAERLIRSPTVTDCEESNDLSVKICETYLGCRCTQSPYQTAFQSNKA